MNLEQKGIYAIICKASGKIYIGSTAKSFKIRWRTHKNALKKNRHENSYLQNAWNKYGEEQFKFIILEATDENILSREQCWIDLAECFEREKGYNISPTAGNSLGCIRSEETKRKQSELKKGKNHPNWGKNLSETTRRKIGEANRIAYSSLELREKVSVVQRGEKAYSAKLTWKQVREIREKYKPYIYTRKMLAEEYSVSESAIQFIIENKHWVDKNYLPPKIEFCSPMSGKRHSEETKNKIANSQKGENSYKSKLTWEKVGQIREKYLTKKYTQQQLAKEYGVTRSCIQAIINNTNWCVS